MFGEKQKNDHEIFVAPNRGTLPALVVVVDLRPRSHLKLDEDKRRGDFFPATTVRNKSDCLSSCHPNLLAAV